MISETPTHVMYIYIKKKVMTLSAILRSFITNIRSVIV